MHPCRRGLCIAISPGALRGPRSYNQMSSRTPKEAKRLDLTILSAARSTFAMYTSVPRLARRAYAPRTKINAFRDFVAAFEQLFDAFSQIFILSFLVLHGKEFKYPASIHLGVETDLVETRTFRCLSNDAVDFSLILRQTSLAR